MIKKLTAIILAAVMVIAAASSTFAATLTTSAYGPGLPMYFNGEQLRMLANRSNSQMMSFVITTANGATIVVDGGTPADAPHLREVIASCGNRVCAWFITHPHEDHVGALTQIIEEGLNGMVIDNIYYNFIDQNIMNAFEPNRAGFAARARAAIESLGSGVAHVIRGGNMFQFDSVVVKVMNDPYAVQENTINNSSVVYKMFMGPSTVTFLGDMGEDVGNLFLRDHAGEDLSTTIVQMAHHGQQGVGVNVYQALKPQACLWCAPAWLYNDTTGKYRSAETQQWVRNLGVKVNLCIKDGDVTLR